MSLQSLLYGTGPDADAEAAADLRRSAAAHAAHMALPVCVVDHVLDAGRDERWMTWGEPGRVGDTVRRHIATALGRCPVVEARTTFAASKISEEMVLTADHVAGDAGWLPGYWEDGRWRTGMRGQIWRSDRYAFYRWSIIRAGR